MRQCGRENGSLVTDRVRDRERECVREKRWRGRWGGGVEMALEFCQCSEGTVYENEVSKRRRGPKKKGEGVCRRDGPRIHIGGYLEGERQRARGVALCAKEEKVRLTGNNP